MDFPCTAQAAATNFKFLRRGGLSAAIGHHWQQSQALVMEDAQVLYPFVTDGV